jgi:murein DD-endopeptidase MepM/ murein hydrolase activator NlpD
VRLLARTQRGLGLRPAVAVALVAATAGGLAAGAARSPAAASVEQAQHQLSAGQQRVSQLAGTVAGAGQQVGDLCTSIGALQSRVARLQTDLSARRRQLLRVRDELDAAQTRLGGLEAAKAAAERVLGEELVGNYEGARPDIVSVVLESNGFEDLLERIAFAQRVSRQDARIVGRVRSARRAVATEAKTLGRLTARAQDVAEDVLSERNQVARSQLKLVAQQLTAAKAKATAAGQLASAQTEVDQLTQQLNTLRVNQPAAPATAGSGAPISAATGTSTSSASGTPIPPASSSPSGAETPGAGIPFPLPAGSAAPPATWSLGEGVSIAAPAGTPELAVCSGTIVLHGVGGLGPSAPVLRCDQPLSGHTYVYYGFAGPVRLAAIGANVTRGQPLARVGDGTIGTSSGPHLEIGFADASGAPLGSDTAHGMLTMLRAAYAS